MHFIIDRVFADNRKGLVKRALSKFRLFMVVLWRLYLSKAGFSFYYLNASAIIPGDAEIIIGDFLGSLNVGSKENVSGVIYGTSDNFKTNRIEDLDALPFPANGTV